MKSSIKMTLLILFALSLTISSQAQKSKSDKDAVTATLMNYLEGGTNGESERVVAAFHPNATMQYIDNKTGEHKIVPIGDFLARVKQNDGKKLDRTYKIVSMDISETAANAKLEIDGGSYIFHDYMNLLKINGEWKIVNKIFQRIEK